MLVIDQVRVPTTSTVWQDARTHLPKGKEAWHLETHGFCFVARPEYDFEEHDQQDFRRVNKEFAPKVFFLSFSFSFSCSFLFLLLEGIFISFSDNKE